MKEKIQMDKKSAVWLSIAIALVIFIGVNYVSSNLHFRLDMTEDNLFTLTDGSKKIIEDLENPVTIKFFFTADHKEVPTALKSFGNNVKEILKEYENINPDMVNLEI